MQYADDNNAVPPSPFAIELQQPISSRGDDDDAVICCPRATDGCCDEYSCDCTEGCITCGHRFFHFDYFSTTDVSTSHFVSPTTLLIYRIAALVEVLVFYIIAWTLSPPYLFFIYLTYWSYTATCIYLILAIIASALQVNGTFPHGKLSDFWFARFIYAFFNTMIAIEAVVVIIFWATIFSGSKTPLELITTIHAHGIIFVTLLVDLFLNKINMPARHVVFCILYGIIYCIFNGIYYAICQGTIYAILNWGSARVIAVIAGVLILLIVMWFALSGLTKLRSHCVRTCGTKGQEVKSGENERL